MPSATSKDLVGSSVACIIALALLFSDPTCPLRKEGLWKHLEELGCPVLIYTFLDSCLMFECFPCGCCHLGIGEPRKPSNRSVSFPAIIRQVGFQDTALLQFLVAPTLEGAMLFAYIMILLNVGPKSGFGFKLEACRRDGQVASDMTGSWTLIKKDFCLS